MHSPIYQKLMNILEKYPLYHEEKGFQGYYLFKKKQKKLVFFVHQDKKGRAYIGVSHRGTSLLEVYPTLKLSADEQKKAILKRYITEQSEIKRRCIQDIIALCYEVYTKHDGYQISPKLQNQ